MEKLKIFKVSRFFLMRYPEIKYFPRIQIGRRKWRVWGADRHPKHMVVFLERI